MTAPITPSDITLRPIMPSDNAALARVIRSTLEEFGANHPGTVYYDESTDRLSEVFERPGSCYLVALHNGKVVGGGGIYPTEGLPEGTAELVKMYLRREVRGIGLGSRIIQSVLDWAGDAGYKQIYLESMPELRKALSTYERFGFKYLDAPMGNSGHFGCGLWMLKTLEV
ncbi:GNAT family N-acetyltransferase [Flaviaesturariibacter flavus]|uniref:GNAT family N-acetyltransferase n=1 Tax=Flaviaesturariibacter flavus TaxID=2502780 RepID=A0A4R1BJV9_9BACT|nr:GNAT family N-acetyltransferase [Flaviaesturariibacter flavus]TCJ17586.1 GNAT family N-acetyltransferase [Flaviaesturariibacter flavus]